MLMCKHRRKSQAIFKPFSDISFARHSDIFRERKKGCITLSEIMTNNQNIKKTSMKDVQQQHFLFKTAIRMTKMFPKSCFFVFVCFFCFSLAGSWRLK